MKMAGVKWSFILLFLIFGSAGCVVATSLILGPTIEKRAEESAEKTGREVYQKMGYNKPILVNVWENVTSLVMVSYGPWQSLNFAIAEERNIAKGMAHAALAGLTGGLVGVLLSPNGFYQDVSAEFQSGMTKILSREKLQGIQAQFNEKVVQDLKVKLGFPIKVVNLDMTGNMIIQSRELSKEWQPGVREVTLMARLIFIGTTPTMRVEVEWTLIIDPIAFEKSFKGASAPPPGWRPDRRPDASGIVRYKSASHSPSQWLEGSGNLLNQELTKAVEQLALEVAQALSGNPTRP